MIAISYLSVMIGITVLWVFIRSAVCLQRRSFSIKRELQLILVYVCIVP